MKIIHFTRSSIIILLTIVNLGSAQSDRLSLEGRWRIALDGNFKDWPAKLGESERWYEKELPSNASLFPLNQIYFKNADFRVNDWIQLPGSTDEAGIGAVLHETQGYTPGLERLHTYDGAFWVQRLVEIPKQWHGKQISLFLERTLGGSTIYWDSKKVGGDYALSVPHTIVVDPSVQSGTHVLSILINKDDIRYSQYGHHLYGGNGASWNGIVGRIELRAKGHTAHLRTLQIYPQLKSSSINVAVRSTTPVDQQNYILDLYCKLPNNDSFTFLRSIENISDSMFIQCPLPTPISLWSEFTPFVYELRAVLRNHGHRIDSLSSTFGMRNIGTQEGYITINGNKVTMRGTLDNGSFPLTGYPFMTKEQWLSVMKTCKSYGLNHIRYHTWCPPEAAFDAADETGIYLQVELAGAPYSEIDRLLDTYGNHPSFCMLSLNNEVLGNTELNESVVAHAQKKDPRHLYTSTSHPIGLQRRDDYFVSAWGSERISDWPYAQRIVGITWGGGDVVHASRFNASPPNTEFTYSSAIKGIPVPVIGHEMGQWAMFPDLNEISKYHSGVLRNTNYERIKKQITANGLLPLQQEMAKASGMFSSILYKEEIESVLRTPGYAGFQMLDLHDYQGQYISIIGILTDFWQSKGLVTPSQHRQYCSAVVPLAMMKKRVWNNTENFESEVAISNFTFEDIVNIRPQWTLVDDTSAIIGHGTFDTITLKKGTVTSIPSITIPLSSIRQAKKLRLRIEIPTLEVENTWDIWVYPSELSEKIGSVNILTSKELDKAEKLVQQGKTVLLFLDPDHLYSKRQSCFTTIFWNSIHKWPQQAHTMGILCDPQHAIFYDFPSESHSNWQWWDVTMNAHAMRMNDLPKEIDPLIKVIDSYIINEKLAYLWECRIGKGKLMVTTMNMTDSLDHRPASKQLRNSILNYMNSARFSPSVTIDFQNIRSLIKK